MSKEASSLSGLLARKGLTAAVVSTDEASRSQLRACLEQTGWVHSVLEWSVPAKGQLTPIQGVIDVVLLDLSSDLGGTESSFSFAAHLRRTLPSSCIVACTHVRKPDPELLMQAMHAGVQEILHKPIDLNVLKGILARFIQEQGLPEETPTKAKKLILVMGAKGGMGTSTVAVHLGVHLAQITQKSVGLLDFARPLGHIALLLDQKARFTICDAAENLERLDSNFFRELLTSHRSGLQVLAGVHSPEEWRRLTGKALAGVVSVAQNAFDYVLIDGGCGYWPEWNSVLDLNPVILLVAEVHVLDLWALQRHLVSLPALGINPERIRVVINRWHPRDEDSVKTVEKSLKHPIFARLPNDYRQANEASNSGRPLSWNHGDPLGSKFGEMASQLVGMATPPVAKRSALSHLLPLMR